ncbi:MAG: HAMP domain-containing protein [Burkholderiaceae bacterium]|nr:MAG: HAMP domain-containing protein [Burkholderiaceae bacterium]
MDPKVGADLAVAQGYFERVLGEVGAATATVADSHALHLALAAPSREAMVPLLREFKARSRLDFINLRSAEGRLLFTDSGPVDGAQAGPAGDADRTSVERLEPAELALVAPALSAQVPIALVETSNAAPDPRAREERALVLLSTHAVRARDGRVLGHVQGGVLLNRNLPFIDHINEIVYPEGSLPFGSVGTATLFLGDVRVSTNVRLFSHDGTDRAIGTRVSQTVRDAVLGRGQTWLDRAFVVNDWYVSAYEPLADSAGERIAMLYVGILESPLRRMKFAALAVIGAIFFAVMLGAATVSLRAARTVFRPVEQMARTMREVEGGAAQARVGPVASGDEIGQLAGHLDQLLDVIDEKTRALQRWNAELDAKVQERTRELEAAQTQLVRSEKLATVGQLTASIAHEVNNPIAVIQGNLDLLRQHAGADVVARFRTELRLIDEQIERVRLIVTQLLLFARPGEYAGYVESVPPARVLEESLVLVRHLLAATRIVVERRFDSERSGAINRQELQQVLVNLLVNAIHAMPEGGTLTLITRDWGGDGVEIGIADTGAGLAPDVLAELFRPFTTRKKDGTGLGLWISRGIVERYGGDIQARNRDDRGGAVFSVFLRSEAPA